MKSSKLPGLNQLRAVAATFVLIGHVYQIATDNGMQGTNWVYWHNKSVAMVSLFFAISGFIITYGLINQLEKTSKINIIDFYQKRIVRIWPIYYLILFSVIILSFFTNVYKGTPYVNFTFGSILMFLLFYVNFFKLIKQPLFILGHYWSLSVEEQFYIFWPALLRKVSIIKSALFVLITMFIIRNGLAFLCNHSSMDSEGLRNLTFVVISAQFGTMAIGAIGAYLLYYKNDRMKIIFHPVIQIITWFIFLLSFAFTKFDLPYIGSEFMAIIYTIIILNVTSNTKTIIAMKNKILDRIGKISYGLYMYHWPIIVVLFKLIMPSKYNGFFMSFHFIPVVALSFILTYIIAECSFKWIETPFLKLKSHAN